VTWCFVWGNKPTKPPVATGLVSLHNQRLKVCLRFCVESFRKRGALIAGFLNALKNPVDWLIVLSNMTQHVCDKVVLRRSSCRGNALSRNNFSCEVREWHHVCKNFGGAITRSWLRPWTEL